MLQPKTLHTTFALCRRANACEAGYRRLAKSLGGITNYGKDTPIPISHVVASNGLDDACWALDYACVPEEKDHRGLIVRLWLCDCAERVLPLCEKYAPEDHGVRRCILVARRFALGQATSIELAGAAGAARAAVARAAWAARAAGAAEYKWQAERLLAYLTDPEPLIKEARAKIAEGVPDATA